MRSNLKAMTSPFSLGESHPYFSELCVEKLGFASLTGRATAADVFKDARPS